MTFWTEKYRIRHKNLLDYFNKKKDRKKAVETIVGPKDISVVIIQIKAHKDIRLGGKKSQKTKQGIRTLGKYIKLVHTCVIFILE